MKNAAHTARVEEADSETAYTTTRAIEFIEQNVQDSWCLHVSYIKPHWPYIAPAPYSTMFTAGDVQTAVRSDSERHDAHPVLDVLRSYLLEWAIRPHNRITTSDDWVEVRTDAETEAQVYIGYWCESELDNL